MNKSKNFLFFGSMVLLCNFSNAMEASLSQEKFGQLFNAAKNGCLAKVIKLVNSGVPVNLYQSNGHTPLHEAAWKGHLPVVEFLTENGADLTSQSKAGHTALDKAIDEGHLATVKYLVKKTGINPGAKDHSSTTPIHKAASAGRKNLVQFFIENFDIDVDLKCPSSGNTLLSEAAKYGMKDVMKYLVEEKKADVNIPNLYGATPLHRAVLQSYNLEAVKYIVETGKAKIDLLNNDKKTPLMVADSWHCKEISEYLKNCSNK